MSEVTEYHGWVATMLKATKDRRQKWVKTILEGIKSYRKEGEKKANPQTKYLSDMLQDTKLYELVGFCPQAQYIRAEGDSLDALFVHAMGAPALLYKHKELPMFIIAGPGLRLHDSVLSENPDNRVESVEGITG
jgi:hypothetical protein